MSFKIYIFSFQVFGEGHPRTVSAVNCLNEPRYKQIAALKASQQQSGDSNIVYDEGLEEDDDDDDDYGDDDDNY